MSSIAGRLLLIVGLLSAGCGFGQGNVDTLDQPVVGASATTSLEAAITSSLEAATTTPQETFYVSVEYRSSPVDLLSEHFEFQRTDGSSVVRGAWYDSANQYMIIKLDSRYYHYCDMPNQAWNSFRAADSYGSFYNSQIKGNFDCRLGFVPEYD